MIEIRLALQLWVLAVFEVFNFIRRHFIRAGFGRGRRREVGTVVLVGFGYACCGDVVGGGLEALCVVFVAVICARRGKALLVL